MVDSMNGDERIKKNLVEFRIKGEISLREVSRRLGKRFASLGVTQQAKKATISSN